MQLGRFFLDSGSVSNCLVCESYAKNVPFGFKSKPGPAIVADAERFGGSGGGLLQAAGSDEPLDRARAIDSCNRFERDYFDSKCTRLRFRKGIERLVPELGTSTATGSSPADRAAPDSRCAQARARAAVRKARNPVDSTRERGR